MTEEDFSQLGAGEIAYVRKISSTDLQKLFPQVPPVQDSMTIYALLNADGTPILLADSREAVLANAFEQELTMVSVH
ncbi:MAG: DUF1150 domain-containing protein [Roseibium sp.]|nr:DUF1150 domain-containing protein [Roseibium sp.]